MTGRELRARIAGMKSYEVDGTTVLISLHPPCALPLDERAEMIFALFSSGHGEPEIATQVGNFFGLDAQRSRVAVQNLLAEWDASLLAADFPTASDSWSAAEAGSVLQTSMSVPDSLLELKCRHECSAPFSIFRIGFRSNDRELIRLLSAEFFEKRSARAMPRALTFTLYSTDEGLFVVAGDRLIASRVTREHFLSNTLLELDALASRLLGYSVVLNASAVVRNSAAVVFPGPKGSGKTSLAGALHAAGFLHYGDHSVVLDVEEFGIVPLPRRLAMKEGLFEAPRRRHPFFPRRDASRILPGSAPVRIRYFIFPEYNPSGDGALRSLPRPEAIRRLFAAGVTANQDASVEGLTEVLANAECFELSYSDLSIAVREIESLPGS